jgi:hypothetical protein
MKIVNASTLNGIKSEFHVMFPFLKLEFYRQAHQSNEASPKADQISGDGVLSEMAGHSLDIEINIRPDMTVAEFENEFSDKTGLSVQVFRNSNGVWLQTSATDTWTLEKQNGKGERSGMNYHIDPVDITDFDVE